MKVLINFAKTFIFTLSKRIRVSIKVDIISNEFLVSKKKRAKHGSVPID